MHSKIKCLRLIVIVHAQPVLAQKKTLTCSLTDQSVRNLLIQIVTLHATNPSVGWLLIQKFSTETSVEWPTTVSISRKSTDSGLECSYTKYGSPKLIFRDSFNCYQQFINNYCCSENSEFLIS